MSDVARTFDHDPVMRDEIVETFRDVPSGVVVDATLGGGGHTEAILTARDDLRALGLDRDPAALDAATRRLDPFGDRLMTHRCRFDELDAGMAAHDVTELAGVIRSRRLVAAALISRPASRTATTVRSTCAWTPMRPGRPTTW
ncbi:MAG: 16S rRNA (cytosine(1402)-N(4))-methyltransferase [Ilumatobacteraceae bacterium]